MLYDIVLQSQEFLDKRDPYPPGVKLTAVAIPYSVREVPPGTVLTIPLEDAGYECHVLEDGLALVSRGEVFYTQSRIITRTELVARRAGDAVRFLASVGEDLLTDTIRAIARLKVEEAQK
jgi:hypothetical protein